MGLNPGQRAARNYIEGPLLVVAGAGSGKTRVITEKIAYLIRAGHVAPEHLAAITFTNKAAKEMRERCATLGIADKRLTVCTFHALGLTITQREHKALGFRRNVTVFDEQDASRLIADIAGLKLSSPELRTVRSLISRVKMGGLNSASAAGQAQSDGESGLAEILAEYERRLKRFNACDFDDLILLPATLLKGNEDARARWQKRIRYVLVDEYQDTNASQYALLRALVGERGGLTAVGDDDQSIYGFRGAEPENLALLKRDFPSLKVIPLEQNYRSSQRILRVANALIENNDHLFEKRLFSELAVGPKLRIMKCEHDQAEAETVVTRLIERRFANKLEWTDFAILYRGNHQARLFEGVLRAHRVPYTLSGGQSFFERAEVKDVIGYLRLLTNDRDDAAFLRIVNAPRRSIGSGTLEALGALAGSLGVSLYAAAKSDQARHAIPERGYAALFRFVTLIESLRKQRRAATPGEMAERVVRESGYRSWLEAQDKSGSKVDNIESLLKWIRGMRATRSLSEVVPQLMLQRDRDKDSVGVRLMTLHAAKGLEFPHVYLVGVEDGRLPHRESLTGAGIQEERRLLYVGLTRARQSITMSFATGSRRRGEGPGGVPSRFLEEMPRDDLLWEGEDEDDEAGDHADAHRARLRELFS